MIEYYHDWNFPNNTGIFIFTLEKEEEGHIVNDVDIPKLEKEIARISELVQKVPDEIYTCPITPSIYCVERAGILIQIEKALIERGFEQELRYTKEQLEKSYFHRHGDFEEIFHKQVRDIFIDWNFHGNKSVLVFILS
ncbi:Na-translocating system protein MpsC family protein [Robertmurraya sp. FSL W8-0741]|uniref:Na-translocating system protein MpsC family protein n=1 Tax=Robertmurraya sp. FSL W8-0741 TaxID=2954629 RepID=UPI0030FB9DD7